MVMVLLHQHPELYQATVERDVMLPQTVLVALELNPYEL